MSIVTQMALRSLQSVCERSLKRTLKCSGEMATHLANAWLNFADEPHTTDKLVQALRSVNLATQTTGQTSELSNEVSYARIALCDLIVLRVTIAVGYSDRDAFFHHLECNSTVDRELKAQLGHSFDKLANGLPGAFASNAKRNGKVRPARQKPTNNATNSDMAREGSVQNVFGEAVQVKTKGTFLEVVHQDEVQTRLDATQSKFREWL